MKRPIVIFILSGFISFLSFACENTKDNSSNKRSSNSSSEENSVSSKRINCFEKYYGKPGDLLTIDLVSNFVDFGGADAEITIGPVLLKGYASASCKWKMENGKWKEYN